MEIIPKRGRPRKLDKRPIRLWTRVTELTRLKIEELKQGDSVCDFINKCIEEKISKDYKHY